MSIDERRAALGDFLVRYLPALLAYVKRFFRSLQPQDAEELVQGFAVDQILDRDLIGRASSDRGKLRSLLTVACKNYCLTQMSKSKVRATKLVGRLDTLASAAEASFERSWAEIVTEEAAARVEARFSSRGQDAYLVLLRAKILDPARGEAAQASSAELSRELGIDPHVMRSMLSKVRMIFVRSLREVVAEYVEGQRGIDEELAGLMRRLT